jgi:CheY-like chemotaxis protein
MEQETGKEWSILVVDDEEDIHLVSKLALRKKVWEGRGFRLTSCSSGAEARKLIDTLGGGSFQVALVDVVMETPTAGLDLCEFIRRKAPRSLRIILRTGQPGVAPEEGVMNDYDIDYYLAKTEATTEKLYSVVRASLKASQEIATFIALRQQMSAMMSVLRAEAKAWGRFGREEKMLESVQGALHFLEAKHDADIVLIPEQAELGGAPASPEPTPEETRRLALMAALRKAHDQGAEPSKLHQGAAYGLGQDEFLMLSPRMVASRDAEAANRASGDQQRPGKLWGFVRGLFSRAATQPTATKIWAEGIVVKFHASAVSGRAVLLADSDLSFFLENWLVMDSLCKVQDQIAGLNLDVSVGL